jgi:hypothetical protein
MTDLVKEKSGSKTVILLNGGLGNQLFGFAAALCGNGDVEILGGISSYSKNQSGLPQIFNLDVSKFANFRQPKISMLSITKKTYNFFLISNLNVRKHWTFRFAKIAEFLFQASLNLLRSRPKLVVADDLGYVDIPKTGNMVLIGYFQSSKWMSVPKVREKMLSLFSKVDCEIDSILTEMQKTKPIVLHVRLGDYRNNQEIGVLPTTYFNNALKLATYNDSNRPIWVFSDEPEAARNMLPLLQDYKCRFISEEMNLTAEQTLALMRFGKKFIISNSTFSWWAAALSEEKEPTVYFPNPWFATGLTPRHLIPLGWIPVERDSLNSTKVQDLG